VARDCDVIAVAWKDPENRVVIGSDTFRSLRISKGVLPIVTFRPRNEERTERGTANDVHALVYGAGRVALRSDNPIPTWVNEDDKGGGYSASWWRCTSSDNLSTCRLAR
jgi:hypothetical protein